MAKITRLKKEKELRDVYFHLTTHTLSWVGIWSLILGPIIIGAFIQGVYAVGVETFIIYLCFTLPQVIYDLRTH